MSNTISSRYVRGVVRHYSHDKAFARRHMNLQHLYNLVDAMLPAHRREEARRRLAR